MATPHGRDTEGTPVSGAARVRRAFSLRRNLRLLFVPPAGHLGPLDGLRALSILWVVVFHAAWYAGRHVPFETYAGLVTSPWMLPVWRGDFAVDVFFVLSGFLIAGLLIDERAGTGRLRLPLFYVRRLVRLWPALVVAVGVEVLVFDDNSSMVWANLLYVSNFVPILQAAMGWTWSLAIEEQFYLLCPWLVGGLALLRGSARPVAFALVVVALAGVAAWVVVDGGFTVHDAEIVINRDFFRWAVGYDHLYSKPWMRAGPLLMGVAAAYVYRRPGAMAALARRRALALVGLAVALAVALVAMHWPLFAGGPRALEVAYLASYRTIFGASVAYGILFSVSQHPVGRALGRVLSSRLLYPFGQLAYSAYLLNPIATNLVQEALAPLVWERGVPPMPLFLPFDLVVTFVAAAVLHLFVERPFMELRPRGRQAPGSG
ncbi:MAG: acyltransferase [Myxococcales bacterium]|nr:acyltransferase [Myxococcales bacterium]